MMGIRSVLQSILDQIKKHSKEKENHSDFKLPLILIDTSKSARLITEKEQQLCQKWCSVNYSIGMNLQTQPSCNRHSALTVLLNRAKELTHVETSDHTYDGSKQQSSQIGASEFLRKEIDTPLVLGAFLTDCHHTKTRTTSMHKGKATWHSSIVKLRGHISSKWLRYVFCYKIAS